jgi:hypothetical protein
MADTIISPLPSITLEPEIKNGAGFYSFSVKGHFFIASDSPVIEDSSQVRLFPFINTPSTGNISPVSIYIMSPTSRLKIDIFST